MSPHSETAVTLTRLGRAFRLFWSVLAGVGILTIGAYLIRPHDQSHSPGPAPAENVDALPPARLIDGLVHIDPQSALFRKLSTATVVEESLTSPLLTVTGSVVACRDPGDEGNPGDHWKLQSTELASLHTDWLKAEAEIQFAEKQLTTLRLLNSSRLKYLETVVARQKRLLEAGTDSEKDFAAAEADMLQARLQGQKDLFEAEMAVQTAQRTRTGLERQMYSAGLDPRLLANPKLHTDIVAADVPEARLTLAGTGQRCTAKFYAFPGEVFHGRVVSLSPALSPERRTLRVFFLIDDPEDRLKPGMFADIGLGTDPHPRLLIPADAVLHIGRSDYVFVSTSTDAWRVSEVAVGEAHGPRYEVQRGLKAGDRVISRGAVLLKPLMLQALAE